METIQHFTELKIRQRKKSPEKPPISYFIISRVKHRFTLIELLITITIIAILAGLLLPVLHSAREKGRAISCTNNLKNIGIGMAAYLNDSQDELMPERATPTSHTAYWLHALLGNHTSNPQAAANQYVPYSIFSCPSMPQKATPSIILGPHKPHYGINVLILEYSLSMNGSFPNETKSGKHSRIKNPSTKFFLCDLWFNSGNSSATIVREEGSWRFGGWSAYPRDFGTIAPRHNSRVNMLYSDFHAASLPGNPADPHTGLFEPSWNGKLKNFFPF